MEIKKDTRYYSLDFWRGLACLMVALYHSSMYVLENPANRYPDFWSKLAFRVINHCDLGVPLFFIISGYCITASCDAARNKSHRVTTYFYRRFRRIFPPFWGACGLLLAAMLFCNWMGYPRVYSDSIHPIHALNTITWRQWLGNLSLTEIWRANIFPDVRWFFLGPSWSLCYEEQFYAICGLLLIFSRRSFFRGAGILTIIVAVIATIYHSIADLPIDGFFFDGRWLLFAAGMLVYYRIHYATKSGAKWAALTLIGGAVLALLWRVALKSTDAEEYYTGFLFAYLLVALYRWDAGMVTSMALRPVIWCGTMCYSLYLIHWPVIKVTSHLFYHFGIRGPWQTLAISIPVSLSAAIVAGWVFHLYVERRFLNSPPVLPWKMGGLTALAVGVLPAGAGTAEMKIETPSAV